MTMQVFRLLSLLPSKLVDTAQSNHGGHHPHDEEHHEANLSRSPGDSIQEIPEAPEDKNRGADEHYFHPNDFFHSLTLV